MARPQGAQQAAGADLSSIKVHGQGLADHGKGLADHGKGLADHGQGLADHGKTLAARAYAEGAGVELSSRPAQTAGHEAAHVVQQAAGRR